MPASSHITHLNTAWISQTKKLSVTFSAALENLPCLFIDVSPIFLDLAGAVLGALFLLFREQPRQLFRHARNLRAAGMPFAGASARQPSRTWRQFTVSQISTRHVRECCYLPSRSPRAAAPRR